MESILSSKFGFQTLLLTDGDSTAAEPTCANLKEILKRSIEGCTEGDQIVLYFSGHTERVKKDGLHEVVCFSDGGVFDEELFEIFASLHENVVITIIVDGCYSYIFFSSFLFFSLIFFFLETHSFFFFIKWPRRT